jgi:glycosyltransferase involved in cell wall biosynthesis
MPTSVLEAMASGLPLASTDVGDVKSLLSGENAPFVVDRNEKALAEALLGLIGDRDLRAKIGEANRNVAARDYTDTTMFARYGKLLGVPS